MRLCDCGSKTRAHTGETLCDCGSNLRAHTGETS